MKKFLSEKFGRIALATVAAVVVLFLGFVVGRMGGAQVNKTALEKKPATPITNEPLIMENWKTAYPLQYNSYMKTAEMGDKAGNYGGTGLYQHSVKQPEILTNFKGGGFGIDYADDRGHYWAIFDNQETKRVNANTKGACTSCKTPYVGYWYEQYGWDYAGMSFWTLYEDVPEGEPGVSCAMCHDPQTAELTIVQPALIDALKTLGVDWTQATVDEMRTLVCAQCHVTYYMDPVTAKVIFPWTEGKSDWTAGSGAAQKNLTVENVWKHYEKVRTQPAGEGYFLSDWVQPDSQTPYVKVRHPDYETWAMGVHGQNGVSCADCHMPYTVENGEKYSSHWMTSPLRTIDASCGKCHDQGSEWLLGRVMQMQENTFQVQHAAGLKVEEGHQLIAIVKDMENVDEALLTEARESLRKAQFYWDYIAAESSMGFHATDQAIRTAAQAYQFATEAIAKAYQAGGLLPEQIQ